MARKRPLRMLAAGAAALLALTACTSDGEDNESPLVQDSRLQTIQEAGTIRVAVLPDFPPFAVQTASGDFEGYEIDIAQELADALEVELELVSTDGASRLPLLNADRADINISSWTSTNERAKAVDFSLPYVADGASVLFRTDNPIESSEDLAGKSVSVTRGSTNDTIMTEDFPDTEIVRFETIADAVEALRAGQVDAAIEGRATVLAEVERDPDTYATLDEPPMRPSLISMGVPQGDQVWLNYVNNFIRNLNASGTNADLYEKWFDSELPELVQ